MASAAAKREARARKIFENAESRLQKITGRVSENPVEGTRFVPEELHETQERDTLSPYQQRFLLAQNLRSDPDIDGLNERLRPTMQENFSSFNDDVENLSQPSSFAKSSATYSLLSSDLSYLFLALVINILCLMNLDHLFGKTIVVPYIAIAVAHLFLQESSRETYPRLLFVAFLCCIKPKLLHKFARVWKLIRGFGLYVFTFVIIRWVLSQFWFDLDITQSDNSMSEAQLNQDI